MFLNANTSYPLSAITSYTWDFGDGTPPVKTNDPATTHMFAITSPGIWQVTLTVQDNAGQTDMTSQLVVFNILPRFVHIPTHPMVGQPVVFNATSTIIYSSPPGPVGFSWSFGDDATGQGPVVKHAYLTPGPYRVLMTVNSNAGQAQISKTLVVAFVPGSDLFNNTFDQTNVTVYGTFNLNQTSRTLTGTVTVTATNATTGEVIFAKSFNITVVYTSNGAARFILAIPTSPLWLGSTCAYNTASGQVQCFVSRNPDPTRNGTVDVIDFGMLAYRYGATLNSPNYDPALDLAGSGTIGIVDAGIMSMDFGAPVYY